MKRIRLRSDQELKDLQHSNRPDLCQKDSAKTLRTPPKPKPDERKIVPPPINDEKVPPLPSEKRSIIGPILYNAEELLPELDPHIHNYIQINVFAQHLTTESNQVKSSELWGAKPYTSDSDVVCMICHSGIYTLMKETPKFYLLKVILYILPGAAFYESCERHGIKSRTWGPHEVSLLPVRAEIIDAPDPVTQLRLEYRHLRTIEKNTAKYVSHSNPANSNTTIREFKGKAFHEKKISELEHMISEILPKATRLLFNLSNELCFQYSREMIFDRGIDPMQWASYRLRNSVVVLESSVRYELSREQPSQQPLDPSVESKPRTHTYDTYRWSKVLSPTEKTREWYSKNEVPLNEPHIQVLASGLDWSQIVWTERSVRINNVEYSVNKLFWIQIHKITED
ncbi:uncharacterized protein LOC126326132 [Schistocerca gregaria]|uniref:uncharacterized protein LOC126326132 n=1 Tax=Schistocerca gregaria TaxID=7010 RepID=UPI00211DBB86|nr:uncharacterized protein LOC126326132 [Schistocerca gregaria]